MQSIMHWFDITVLTALLVSGVWSLFRGLIREVLSLLGLGAALVLALHGSPSVALRLEVIIAELWVRQAVSFALIFLSGLLLSALCIKLFQLFIQAAGLSLFDRLLGGLFGVVKVILVVSVLFLVGPKFFPTLTTTLEGESVTAPLFVQSAAFLATFLEKYNYESFQRLYRQGVEQLLPSPPPSSSPPQALPSASKPPADASNQPPAASPAPAKPLR
jgi:membrane protein required for colicin V production